MGYDIEAASQDGVAVYNKLLSIGTDFGLVDAGFRAFHSLSCEKGVLLSDQKLCASFFVVSLNHYLSLAGIHLWGTDLRSDDTPLEANLGYLCRKNGAYKGQNVIEKQQKDGVFKRLVYFTVNEEVPLLGLEGIYRNGEAVGHLRRAEFGYTIQKSIGQSYIHRSDGSPIDIDFLKQATYEIDVMGCLHPAKLHIKSPFDHTDQRILGFYNEIPEKLT